MSLRILEFTLSNISLASAFSSSLTKLDDVSAIQISPVGIFNLSLYSSAFLGFPFAAVYSLVSAIWLPSLLFKIALTVSPSFRGSFNFIIGLCFTLLG